MEEAPKPWHSYDTVFLNAKAGMKNVDKEKIQKVVYEMSKGSRFFENEQRKESELLQRIEKLRMQLSKLSSKAIDEIKPVVDKRVAEIEASCDLTRIWMHVDLDAFYAAVEALRDDSLNTKPMAVGSMSMICTANYEARKFGVRAAMPGFIACKLCPELILIKPDFEKYSHYSELTRQVFRLYDERFLARSMDEAYLDITDFCKSEGLAPSEVTTYFLMRQENGRSRFQVAEKLRMDVCEKTKLTCSAGVAPNRLLAKVCSDINKPNGQFILPNELEKVMDFVAALPCRKVSGIGKVTERLLKEVLNISTCSDLIENRYVISALFSSVSRDFFLSVGLGVGGTERPAEEGRKSISSERTFTATSDELVLMKILGELAGGLADDMAKEGLRGRTVTLKLKTERFEVRNRAVSLGHPICSKEDIEACAIKLLKAEMPLSLRLIGVRLSQFEDLDRTQKSITSFLHTKSKQFDVLSPVRASGVEEEEGLSVAEEQMPSLESRASSLNSEKWTGDERCSVCGVKISTEFPSTRQEHEDYHFAEKLQLQQDSSSSITSSDSARKRRKLQEHSIEFYFKK